MRIVQRLAAMFLLFFLVSCADSHPIIPTVTQLNTPSPSPFTYSYTNFITDCNQNTHINLHTY